MDRKFSVSSPSGGRRPVSGRTRSSRRRPGCIRIFVCPTTGGRLEISVSPRETVLGLKAALARKLRVPPNRLTLIYKNKVLQSGCLLDYKIPDEGQITLLPNMEAGLTLQQSDKSILQALENLSESQVNDFLSGRAPLMLALRLGEHMVFVQLQLSCLQAAAAAAQPARTNQPGGAASSATVLSQRGLSPSALAQATRCLSQRLHRLHQLNRAASARPSSRSSTLPTSNTSSHHSPIIQAPQLVPNPNPRALSTSTATAAASPQTLMRLPTTRPLVQENPVASPPPSPGAMIDSMKHMGKGVYTGTFSGTLDSSLQDRNGQPRRSVSTILHILNDLLVAGPQSPQKVATQSHAVPFTSVNTPSTVPSPVPEDSNADNEMLRGKMQRIQMMLAKRKEQRRNRREMSSPYIKPVSSSSDQAPEMSSMTTTPAMPTSSIFPAANSSAVATVNDPSTCSTVPSHNESSGDASYCMTSIEQDSLAV